MFNKMDRMSVMCRIAFVNIRVRIRYSEARTNPAAATNSSRIAV